MASKRGISPFARLKRGMGRFMSRHGLNRARPRDKDAFVTDLYLGILGREPDAEGFAHFRHRLGPRPTFRAGAQLLRTVVGSEEARQKRENDLWMWRRATPPPQQAVRAVFSLGTHCLTSMVLKANGLKQSSGPFDWIFSSIGAVAHCIEDDFTTFLDPAQHEAIPLEKRTVPDANLCDHRFYRDKHGVHTMFNHRDITRPADYAYYERCVARFRAALRSDDRTLLVMVTPHGVRKADFERLCRALTPYPNAELLIVHANRQPGRFGGQLMESIGRHKLHNLYLIGDLGSISFLHPNDALMFHQILGDYRFATQPGAR